MYIDYIVITQLDGIMGQEKEVKNPFSVRSPPKLGYNGDRK